MYKFAAVLILAATPVFAEDTTTSGLIAKQGISATVTDLQGQPQSADRDIALAASLFLQGIQQGYQARWKIGSTQPMVPFPILGSELPHNPQPETMKGSFLNDLATEMIGSMQAAREVLPSEDAALVLKLDDLWLDVDGDGKRSPQEDLTALIGLPVTQETPPVIRFDTADVQWMRAYTHLVEGLSHTVLAFNPETAITQTLALNAEVERQREEMLKSGSGDGMEAYDSMNMYDMQFGSIADKLAIIIQTLRNQPDAEEVKLAAENFNQMIAANRKFWLLVAAETDDDREWIPNDKQHAALGFELPPGTGPSWLGVLDDGEQILSGQKLIPYWRFAPGYGINLKAWIDDPAPVDLVGWIQGSAALPYTQQGDTITSENWSRFAELMMGREFLFMLMFN